ncbi:MAG: hypothetical protein QWI37_02985 [Candidatus Cardinium sp.]|nr:hypothetical protein [Candidatus Cardinium sp.]
MFYTPLQGKEGLKNHTSYTVSHVKEAKAPFLRHTEGCKSVGLVWHRMPGHQMCYGIYYHGHLSPSIALRLSGGISLVKFNYKKHIRWVIAPSFLYTLCAINAHHYIGLSLGPIIEYGSYQAAIFGLPNRNGWDIRVTLGPHYTFYFNQKWTTRIEIGPCIGFFKNKGKSGLLGSLCLQYNL